MASHQATFTYLSTKEYIVFIDQKEDVDWETNPDFDEETLKDPLYNLQKQNSISTGRHYSSNPDWKLR